MATPCRRAATERKKDLASIVQNNCFFLSPAATDSRWINIEGKRQDKEAVTRERFSEFLLLLLPKIHADQLKGACIMLGFRHSWLRASTLTLAGLLLASGASWALDGDDMTIAQLQPTAKDNKAHLLIVVPENAELWFNGAKTTQTGQLRDFASPELTPRRNYSYHVVASWMENGKKVEQVRTERVQANDWRTIDFTKPEPSPPKAEK